MNPDHIIAVKYARRLHEEFRNQDAPDMDEVESYATEIIREAIWEAMHDMNAEGLCLMKLLHDTLMPVLGHEELHAKLDKLRVDLKQLSSPWKN